MPLEDDLPQIDNRRYDDIIEEVRTRIARYTPEWQPVWTDLNDSDPGITMVQVFAWLTEMLMYRMAQVPKLSYIKFLELVGIELNPSEPARAEITFPITKNHTQSYVIIPAQTQVSGEDSEGGPPAIFETERAVHALTAQLQALVAFDGYEPKRVMVENDNANEGFLPFGPLARAESALMFGFGYGGNPARKDFPSVEVDLAFWVMPDPGASEAVQCGFPKSLQYPPATLRWEFWNGRDWAGLDLLKDETLALTHSGHVRFRVPSKEVLQPEALAGEQEKYLWLRVRVVESQYERPPRLRAVRTNTVSAIQAETIQNEVLGGSNGRRDQSFQLANSPVLAGTLHLEVDEGDGYKSWEEKNDFFGSKGNDKHYVLNRTSGEVRFGDGIHGAIPVANVNNAGANVVARQYRFGGGKHGNLPAGNIKTLVTSVEGVDAGHVGNLFPAYAGRNEETLEEAKKRAPQSIKSRCRAVTIEDYEYLARQAGNVRRAKALPLYHPAFPGIQVPGVITVIVVPNSEEPNPIPSEGTLRTVCAYLDQRRILTTEVYVVRPTYQQVKIDVEVIIKDNADLAEVKPAIEESLLNYFHPLKGGEDDQGWPFGATIFYSRVHQRVFAVPGVQTIKRLTIYLDGEEAPECRDVDLKPGALAFSTEHQVNVQYSFED
jgi:predicted phage baseplate assembly protein